MKLKEEFLRQINNGEIRGAKVILAEKMNVAPSTVGRWFSGTQFPTDNYIVQLAQLSEWPEDKVRAIFAQDAPDYVYDNKPEEVVMIPVLGTSSATEEKFILEEIESYLPIKKSSSSKQFAVRVEGNCMVDPEDPQNSIYHGNYIVVDPEAEVVTGDVVLARIDGEYSTIKRFFPSAKGVKLIPDNPKCKTLIFSAKQVQVVGKVINVYHPVKRKKARE